MTVATQKLTFSEYLAYCDGADTPCELVDGELVPMSVGTGHHADIAEFLNDEFRAQVKQAQLPWVSKQMTVGVQSPRGTRWDTSRIPDVTVLGLDQWKSMRGREAIINLNEPRPHLVVEVVSRSTKADDYRSKPSEYALLEIPEYWIVDPLDLKVTVCVLDYRVYESIEFVGESIVKSPTFPSLKLSASQILA